MPIMNPSTASAQASSQTFTEFLVVNGVKVRPLITVIGSDVIIAWEFEVDGVWKEQSSRKNQ